MQQQPLDFWKRVEEAEILQKPIEHQNDSLSPTSSITHFFPPNDGQSIVGAIYLVMVVIWCLILGMFVCVNKCRKMKPKRRAIVQSESMRNVLKNLWFEGLQRPGIEMSEEFNADERIVVTNSERGQIDKIGHVALNISQG
ncbi:unnamed protein product [Caenorhabditis nigoni]|uniref:Uncharacterized protein n=1 Tax=Caenorhabditis nigoni TaxID=1611254 RepID=A0A2G5SDS6_9PELO|nr:hypothetical protein B9Z55_027867 [Caenorhabditis nigoni]